MYFTAEGIAKFALEKEYRLLQSTSTVPGWVIRVFTCSRLRSVIADERFAAPAPDRRKSAGCAVGRVACTIAAAVSKN